MSASIIQRAYRRYRAKVARNKLIARQIRAAVILQTALRRILARTRIHKSKAALVIQKNWRKKVFIWYALLRKFTFQCLIQGCKYQKPLKVLHTAASKIQKTWRVHYADTHSPFAIQFKTRLRIIDGAVHKISTWWRRTRLIKGRAAVFAKQTVAAVTIQRFYKGYQLRKNLREDIRQKLGRVGVSLVHNRCVSSFLKLTNNSENLRRLHAAYVIGKAWRSYQKHKVFKEAFIAWKRAATKIQSWWRGHLARICKIYL